MRAFLGQFDRVSGAVFALGATIGAIWLVALDLGEGRRRQRLETRHEVRRARRGVAP
jgi:hypothetical protein